MSAPVNAATNAAWLAQLAPDRAPPPPGWWPPAPGWWGVAALLLIGLIGLAWVLYRRRVANGPRRWRRAAERELAQLDSDTCDDATLARRLQHLLRRYAVARYGRDAVAALSGEAWLAFVVEHGGADWAGEPGRQLLRCAYGGTAPGAATGPGRERWLAGARAFLRARA